jgi:hypothetical protein
MTQQRVTWAAALMAIAGTALIAVPGPVSAQSTQPPTPVKPAVPPPATPAVPAQPRTPSTPTNPSTPAQSEKDREKATVDELGRLHRELRDTNQRLQQQLQAAKTGDADKRIETLTQVLAGVLQEHDTMLHYMEAIQHRTRDMVSDDNRDDMKRDHSTDKNKNPAPVKKDKGPG